MRSFDGQFSDNRPLKRTREEKVRLLAELKETVRTMKPHTSPELRVALRDVPPGYEFTPENFTSETATALMRRMRTLNHAY